MAFVSRVEGFLENRFKEWRTRLEEWKKKIEGLKKIISFWNFWGFPLQGHLFECNKYDFKNWIVWLDSFGLNNNEYATS